MRFVAEAMQIVQAMFFFIVAVVNILLVCEFPIYIFVLARAYRIRKIAKKFNLSYKSGISKFFLVLPDKQESNIIRTVLVERRLSLLTLSLQLVQEFLGQKGLYKGIQHLL